MRIVWKAQPKDLSFVGGHRLPVVATLIIHQLQVAVR